MIDPDALRAYVAELRVRAAVSPADEFERGYGRAEGTIAAEIEARFLGEAPVMSKKEAKMRDDVAAQVAQLRLEVNVLRQGIGSGQVTWGDHFRALEGRVEAWERATTAQSDALEEVARTLIALMDRIKSLEKGE